MEIENEHLLITRTKRIDNNKIEEDLQIIALRRKLKHLTNWAQRFVDRLPVRMTLSNLGILAVFLAIVLPKSLTYILLYPIFRLVFGTLYPAYASYKAVRTQNVKEYVKWMMYWIVFALFTCAETFTDVFFSFWFPFYYEIKIILVLWLLSPATKGSSILYRRFVHPALTRREAEIDEALARATEQGYKAVLHLGTRGVNYATTVLMQTAIKNLPNIIPSSLNEIEPRQSDPAIFSSANPNKAPSTTRRPRNKKDTVNPTKDDKVVPTTKKIQPPKIDHMSITKILNDYENTSSSGEEEEEEEEEVGHDQPEVYEEVKENLIVEGTFKEPEGRPIRTKKSGKEHVEGGGGLVQQLRKSYSLSDLTGGKDVENRSLPESQDETDMEVEPRRREHVGRRGYSPRRTQSSTNRVEMYFSEVDVDMIQPRPREPITSLTNIRSSDDISSGYSSGEALQSHRAASQGDALVRTSSVGARTRVKPRSTTKKTPEDTGEESEYDDLLPSPLTFLTPDQVHQLLLLLTPNDDLRKISKFDNNEKLFDDIKQRESKSSSEESEVWFVPNLTNETDEEPDKPRTKFSETDNKLKDCQRSTEMLTISSSKESNLRQKDMENKERTEIDFLKNSSQTTVTTDAVDIDKIKDEICREKLDELKELLNNAHKAVTKIVSSEEKLNRIGKFVSDKTQSLENFGNVDSLNVCSTTNDVTQNNSDTNDRAGKYNKMPAPKTPILTDDEILSEDSQSSQNALKATLVIKTGTVKTFSNVDNAKDVFIAHAAQTKTKRKKRSKDGIAKLLAIPKNIFHGAFNKTSSTTSNKDEESSPSVSEYCSSRSRSVSVGSRQDIVTNKINNDQTDTDPNEISSNVDNEKIDENNFKKDKTTEDPDRKMTKIKRIPIPRMSRSPGASRKVYSNENIA
ncbi:bromodomain-containing protein -like isoform X1 [Vespula squamosa]|uniref:Bromodomain-containing protein -like isoform X1 n=1 Tax=Vespula squamosa TaxID=30214 RepID=A0ABD2AJ52_VESSQ